MARDWTKMKPFVPFVDRDLREISQEEHRRYITNGHGGTIPDPIPEPGEDPPQASEEAGALVANRRPEEKVKPNLNVDKRGRFKKKYPPPPGLVFKDFYKELSNEGLTHLLGPKGEDRIFGPHHQAAYEKLQHLGKMKGGKFGAHGLNYSIVVSVEKNSDGKIQSFYGDYISDITNSEDWHIDANNLARHVGSDILVQWAGKTDILLTPWRTAAPGSDPIVTTADAATWKPGDDPPQNNALTLDQHYDDMTVSAGGTTLKMVVPNSIVETPDFRIAERACVLGSPYIPPDNAESEVRFLVSMRYEDVHGSWDDSTDGPPNLLQNWTPEASTLTTVTYKKEDKTQGTLDLTGINPDQPGGGQYWKPVFEGESVTFTSYIAFSRRIDLLKQALTEYHEELEVSDFYYIGPNVYIIKSENRWGTATLATYRGVILDLEEEIEALTEFSEQIGDVFALNDSSTSVPFQIRFNAGPKLAFLAMPQDSRTPEGEQEVPLIDYIAMAQGNLDRSQKAWADRDLIPLTKGIYGPGGILGRKIGPRTYNPNTEYDNGPMSLSGMDGWGASQLQGYYAPSYPFDRPRTLHFVRALKQITDILISSYGLSSDFLSAPGGPGAMAGLNCNLSPLAKNEDAPTLDEFVKKHVRPLPVKEANTLRKEGEEPNVAEILLGAKKWKKDWVALKTKFDSLSEEEFFSDASVQYILDRKNMKASDYVGDLVFQSLPKNPDRIRNLHDLYAFVLNSIDLPTLIAEMMVCMGLGYSLDDLINMMCKKLLKQINDSTDGGLNKLVEFLDDGSFGPVGEFVGVSPRLVTAELRRAIADNVGPGGATTGSAAIDQFMSRTDTDTKRWLCEIIAFGPFAGIAALWNLIKRMKKKDKEDIFKNPKVPKKDPCRQSIKVPERQSLLEGILDYLLKIAQRRAEQWLMEQIFKYVALPVKEAIWAILEYCAEDDASFNLELGTEDDFPSEKREALSNLTGGEGDFLTQLYASLTRDEICILLTEALKDKTETTKNVIDKVIKFSEKKESEFPYMAKKLSERSRVIDFFDKTSKLVDTSICDEPVFDIPSYDDLCELGELTSRDIALIKKYRASGMSTKKIAQQLVLRKKEQGRVISDMLDVMIEGGSARISDPSSNAGVMEAKIMSLEPGARAAIDGAYAAAEAMFKAEVQNYSSIALSEDFLEKMRQENAALGEQKLFGAYEPEKLNRNHNYILKVEANVNSPYGSNASICASIKRQTSLMRKLINALKQDFVHNVLVDKTTFGDGTDESQQDLATHGPHSPERYTYFADNYKGKSGAPVSVRKREWEWYNGLEEFMVSGRYLTDTKERAGKNLFASRWANYRYSWDSKSDHWGRNNITRYDNYVAALENLTSDEQDDLARIAFRYYTRYNDYTGKTTELADETKLRLKADRPDHFSSFAKDPLELSEQDWNLALGENTAVFRGADVARGNSDAKLPRHSYGSRTAGTLTAPGKSVYDKINTWTKVVEKLASRTQDKKWPGVIGPDDRWRDRPPAEWATGKPIKAAVQLLTWNWDIGEDKKILGLHEPPLLGFHLIEAFKYYKRGIKKLGGYHHNGTDYGEFVYLESVNTDPPGKIKVVYERAYVEKKQKHGPTGMWWWEEDAYYTGDNVLEDLGNRFGGDILDIPSTVDPDTGKAVSFRRSDRPTPWSTYHCDEALKELSKPSILEVVYTMLPPHADDIGGEFGPGSPGSGCLNDRYQVRMAGVSSNGPDQIVEYENNNHIKISEPSPFPAEDTGEKERKRHIAKARKILMDPDGIYKMSPVDLAGYNKNRPLAPQVYRKILANVIQSSNLAYPDASDGGPIYAMIKQQVDKYGAYRLYGDAFRVTLRHMLKVIETSFETFEISLVGTNMYDLAKVKKGALEQWKKFASESEKGIPDVVKTFVQWPPARKGVDKWEKDSNYGPAAIKAMIKLYIIDQALKMVLVTGTFKISDIISEDIMQSFFANVISSNEYMFDTIVKEYGNSTITINEMVSELAFELNGVLSGVFDTSQASDATNDLTIMIAGPKVYSVPRTSQFCKKRNVDHHPIMGDDPTAPLWPGEGILVHHAGEDIVHKYYQHLYTEPRLYDRANELGSMKQNRSGFILEKYIRIKFNEYEKLTEKLTDILKVEGNEQKQKNIESFIAKLKKFPLEYKGRPGQTDAYLSPGEFTEVYEDLFEVNQDTKRPLFEDPSVFDWQQSLNPVKFKKALVEKAREGVALGGAEGAKILRAVEVQRQIALMETMNCLKKSHGNEDARGYSSRWDHSRGNAGIMWHTVYDVYEVHKTEDARAYIDKSLNRRINKDYIVPPWKSDRPKGRKVDDALPEFVTRWYGRNNVANYAGTGYRPARHPLKDWSGTIIGQGAFSLKAPDPLYEEFAEDWIPEKDLIRIAFRYYTRYTYNNMMTRMVPTTAQMNTEGGMKAYKLHIMKMITQFPNIDYSSFYIDPYELSTNDWNAHMMHRKPGTDESGYAIVIDWSTDTPKTLWHDEKDTAFGADAWPRITYYGGLISEGGQTLFTEQELRDMVPEGQVYGLFHTKADIIGPRGGDVSREIESEPKVPGKKHDNESDLYFYESEADHDSWQWGGFDATGLPVNNIASGERPTGRFNNRFLGTLLGSFDYVAGPYWKEIKHIVGGVLGGWGSVGGETVFQEVDASQGEGDHHNDIHGLFFGTDLFHALNYYKNGSPVIKQIPADQEGVFDPNTLGGLSPLELLVPPEHKVSAPAVLEEWAQDLVEVPIQEYAEELKYGLRLSYVFSNHSENHRLDKIKKEIKFYAQPALASARHEDQGTLLEYDKTSGDVVEDSEVIINLPAHTSQLKRIKEMKAFYMKEVPVDFGLEVFAPEGTSMALSEEISEQYEIFSIPVFEIEQPAEGTVSDINYTTIPGAGGTVQKQLWAQMKQNDNFKVLFEYVFPLKRMLGMIGIYNIFNYSKNIPDFENPFHKTSSILSQLMSVADKGHLDMEELLAQNKTRAIIMNMLSENDLADEKLAATMAALKAAQEEKAEQAKDAIAGVMETVENSMAIFGISDDDSDDS